ncbi:MAG: chloride channel protein [Ignavibacteriaceae bacterium]
MKKRVKIFRVYIKLFFRRFLFILRQRVELKTFIIIASLVVGILSGLAAVLLKSVVHFFQEEPQKLFKNINAEYLFAITPLLGIILSVIIVGIFFSGKIHKSLSHIIYLILRKNSDIPRRKMISHIITSGITVGMGGSAGLEAPIVMTGAAIGSNVAKELKFNYQTRTLLLACGSAAGISAIFNSPIAGVIFAFEVLLPEFSIPSLIPLLIASAASAVLSKLLYSGQIFYLITEGWVVEAIPFYVLLGVLCGFISLYMIKTSLYIDEYSEKINKPYLKALGGGIVLCLLIFLFPPLYGEGYATIIDLLAGNFSNVLSNSVLNFIPDIDLALILLAAAIILVKVFAFALTISSGGNGGIIAPSLFTGALSGFFLAHLIGYLDITNLNHSNFIVVGMAGILSGVLHSPLTGIFLIAEVTGGYILIVPLMIVTALSYFISRYFHPHSIYTAPLQRRGIRFRTETEKYFIQQLSIGDIVEKDFSTIRPGMTLRELVEKISQTKRNLFPVVDDNKKLIGIVTLDAVREFLLNTELYDVILVYEIMSIQYASVDINTNVNKVLEIFESAPGGQIWNVAVTRNGEYVGFISKSTIFNRYISIWAKQQKDNI